MAGVNPAREQKVKKMEIGITLLFVAFVYAVHLYFDKMQTSDILDSNSLLSEINAAKQPLVIDVTPLREPVDCQKWTLLVNGSLWMITKYSHLTSESYYAFNTETHKHFALLGSGLTKFKEMVVSSREK